MSDSFKIQQNVKVGNDLINLRADSPQEFESIANWVVENAGLLVNVQTALNAVPPALAGNVTRTQVIGGPYPSDQGVPATQQDNPGWGAPQQQGPPSWANPAQQAPSCQHGPMVYRTGNGAKGPWSGHFCPTPKGTPGQCPPKFQNNKG